jgi:hypothetical protein
MTCNQRAAGFNYGIGWGSGPKPAIYNQGIALANRLGDQASEASRDAWQVEHALWCVRVAETEIEKADAINALKGIVYKYDLALVTD